MAQATGLLGLKPWEFWELTPRDFANMLNGHRQSEDAKWQRTAQLASWIMSAQLGKKAPTADKLLGKEASSNQRKERPRVVSIEEKRKTLDELEQALGKAVNE